MDENESLTITTILVGNSKGGSETRDKWVRALKKYNNQFWKCKQSQKSQGQGKVRESSQGKGEVEQKG